MIAAYQTPIQVRAAAELERRKRDSSKTPRYIPLGQSATLQTDESPELILSGPAGTGKSRACMEKIHYLATTYKGSRILMIRKHRASLSQSGLVTLERDVLGLNHPLVINGPQRAFRQAYRYPNGSEIAIGGIDNPGKILSAEYDVIYVQQAEELTENDWETLTTRLRAGAMPYQQMIGDCNPDAPTHWLKRRADAGRCLMLESRHQDNPILWNGQDWTERGKAYIAKLDALTGARYRRLRLGQWAAAEGAVYEEWDRAVHLIDRFDIPPNWRRFRVVDFGYTNPFVCQFWAVDEGDSALYLYREIYMSQRIVEDHARQILEVSKGEHFETTVADHDAEDRATLERYRIRTLPAVKDVSTGIQAVQARLRVGGNDKPRLFILRNSLVEMDERLEEAKLPYCTEHEFDGYIWQKSAEGKPVKEAPVKVNDHGMDALRYAVMYMDAPRLDAPLPDIPDESGSRWTGRDLAGSRWRR